MKIDFERPPINEVSIGMHFAPLLSLRVEHVGLFWSQLREDFPTSQQVLPIGNVAPLPPELFPMPRFWLTSKDDSMLIQIQKSGFWFNWRLRSEEYPRFESVFAAFVKHRDSFTRFLREELQIGKLDQPKYQLTYTNLFEQVPYWSKPEQTPAIIPSFSIVELGITEAKIRDFNSLNIFDLASDLSLSVGVRNGLNNMTKRPVLVLELDATGQHKIFESGDANAWYERAHKAISAAFVGLTSPTVQQQFWIRK